MFLGVVLLATAAFRIAAQTGTATLTVQPAVSTTSLLAGKTPATFTSLAGWTTVLSEDFHTGGLTQATGGANSEYTIGSPGIVTGASHTYGNSGFALRDDVHGDAATIDVGVGDVPASAEQYMSWWVNYSANVNDGDDFFLGRVVSHNNNQDCKADPGDGGMPANYLGTTSTNVMVCEGPFHLADYPHASNITLNCCQWTQYEFWFRGNSCSGNSPNNDGFYRFYVNGVLNISNPGANLTGCPAFSTGATKMETDGVYTAYMFSPGTTTSSPCLPGDNSSGGNVIRCNPFAACPKTQGNGKTCLGSVTTFSRWTTDVIMLRR
jgi:hypothetical protein